MRYMESVKQWRDTKEKVLSKPLAEIIKTDRMSLALYSTFIPVSGF